MSDELARWELSDDQRSIQAAVDEGMKRFPLDYWREVDRRATFPDEFVSFAAAQGWLGVAMPAEFGGAGLGVSAAVVMMEAVSRGGGMTGASAIHMNVFGTNVVVKNGSPEMKRQYLPDVIAGKLKVAFGVTEPESGLDTTSLRTRAVRRGGDWVVNGRKVWISTAQVADKILLLARTRDPEPGEPQDAGLTLFFTDLDRGRITVREIEKLGRAGVDSNELFIDDLIVPDTDRVGEEGRGFRLLLDGLNPERLMIAAEAVGIGRAALAIAADYATQRVVFGRPIGQNQGIQFPLADSYARLESVWLMILRGAELYDRGRSCGAEANISKLLGAEYGFQAADRAMQVLGGYGYAKEYHLERLWREVKLTRLAPVSPELILCYLAERKLGLPKSY
jgi:acyl-CoA dehydrogenase